MSSGGVNNAWSYASTSPNVFMAWFLMKHRVIRAKHVRRMEETHKNAWSVAWGGGEGVDHFVDFSVDRRIILELFRRSRM